MCFQPREPVLSWAVPKALQGEEGDSAPLPHYFTETPPAVLGLALGSPAQERLGPAGSEDPDLSGSPDS